MTRQDKLERDKTTMRWGMGRGGEGRGWMGWDGMGWDGMGLRWDEDDNGTPCIFPPFLRRRYSGILFGVVVIILVIIIIICCRFTVPVF